MSQDKALTRQRLAELWGSEEVPVLDTQAHKYAIISDIHLGDGGGADDFHENEETLLTALDHYNREGYSLILLGDIEEFWQFDLDKILQRYQGTIYSKIKAFGDNRVYRVFGNHDSEWKRFEDPVKNNPPKLQGATEALKLKDKDGNVRILLIHGHQGSTESDRDSWFSRFWVRLYSKVEPVLKLDPHTEATKSQITKDYEQVMYSWAKEAKVILICGHSHRAIFAAKSYAEVLEDKIADRQAEIYANRTNVELVKQNLKEIARLIKESLSEKLKGREIDATDPEGKPVPCYFNTGCALYTDGITAIEMADDKIRLVKWDRDTSKVPRFEAYQEGVLSSFVSKVVNQV
ncbi:MAG: metallophosphoesterase [Candidatus Zixiibacteriota bacterium]